MKSLTSSSYFCVGCLCILAFNFGTIKSKNIYENWIDYKKKFDKKYKNDHEDRARFNIFADNSDWIDRINEKMQKELKSYRAGYTQFTDLTLKEYQSLMGVKERPSRVADPVIEGPTVDDSKLPGYFDYREKYKSRMPPVKNQFNPNNCRAGYAFGSVASIEIHWLSVYSLSVDLSAQEIIDCSEPHVGCQGGDHKQAFQYVMDHGLETEMAYPYIGDAYRNCQVNHAYDVIKLKKYTILPQPENDWRKYLVEIGPFTVEIDPGSKYFQHYIEGVLEDPDCGMRDNGTHYVSIVGYGQQQDSKYWIAKNSFGTQWGLDGYILLKRGVNQCGIGSNAILPEIQTIMLNCFTTMAVLNLFV